MQCLPSARTRCTCWQCSIPPTASSAARCTLSGTSHVFASFLQIPAIVTDNFWLTLPVSLWLQDIVSSFQTKILGLGNVGLFLANMYAYHIGEWISYNVYRLHSATLCFRYFVAEFFQSSFTYTHKTANLLSRATLWGLQSNVYFVLSSFFSLFRLTHTYVYFFMQNFASIGWTVAELLQIKYFQYHGRPPSCIRCTYGRHHPWCVPKGVYQSLYKIWFESVQQFWWYGSLMIFTARPHCMQCRALY